MSKIKPIVLKAQTVDNVGGLSGCPRRQRKWCGDCTAAPGCPLKLLFLKL